MRLQRAGCIPLDIVARLTRGQVHYFSEQGFVQVAEAMDTHRHLIAFPTLALSWTVLAFNFWEDAVRDVLAPKRQNR